MTKNKKILIVEDSSTQAIQLQYLLEKHGFETVIAANGRIGLALAREEKPALIISDVVMPELDGYGLCRELKNDEKLKEIPFMLVTSLADSEDVVKGLECGADNFIRKPYEENYLIYRIEYLLMNMTLRENQRMRMGVEISLNGRKHFITAERQQILDLLISTYEQAMHINEELKVRENELARSNHVLNGLYRIAEGLNEAGSVQAVAEMALERALELSFVKAGWIFLLDGSSSFRLAASCKMLGESLSGECICQKRFLSGEMDRSGGIVECERLGRMNGTARFHASIPLAVGEKRIGLMNLIGKGEGGFDDAELRVLQNIGDQVSVALERARLHDHMEKLVEERTAELRAEISERMRIEGEQKRLLAIIEATPDFVGTADLEGRPLYINRAGLEMLGEDAPESIFDVDPQWAAAKVREEGIPAALREGSWSGETAFLKDGREIPLSQVIISHKGGDDVEYLSTVARDISKFKEQEVRIGRLNRVHAVLSGINNTIVRIRDRKELLERSCSLAVEQGKFALAWIGMVSDSGIETASMAGMTMDAELLENGTLITKALLEQSALVCNDISLDSGFSVRNMNEGSIALFPLRVNAQAVGIFLLYTREKNFFDKDEMALLLEVAGDISFGLDHIAKEDRLNYLAFYDMLTGLPNRDLIFDRLNQMLDSEDQVAVLVMDIERFRGINETLGRHAGDSLLKLVATRLSDNTSDKSHLARISGDSFCLVLRDFRNEADVVHFIEKKIMGPLSQPFQVGGIDLRVSFRFGIAMYPANGQDAETLFRNAEAAVKKTKISGERHLFYTPEFNERVAEKLTIENKLRLALERDEFVLNYQPKVDLATGRISSLEALLLWQDPEKGIISPASFIPVLEETGLILEVGRWALSRSAEDSRAFGCNGTKPPRIAVNVSALQLRQKDFVGMLNDALGESANGFDLEITESLVMQDIEANIGKLSLARKMGLEVAVDDFGTGYSSLSYIARLPVNALKIDRSFIVNMTRNSDDLSIVSTIIALAHSLGMKVISEGVETREQAVLLKLLRCDEIQGYLFSPAVPPETITRYLCDGKRLDLDG